MPNVKRVLMLNLECLNHLLILFPLHVLSKNKVNHLIVFVSIKMGSQVTRLLHTYY